MKYKASVREEWLLKYPCFIKDGDHSVECKACHCVINVKRGSIKQLEKHVATKKHYKNSSAVSNNRKVDSMTFTDKMRKTANSELIFCYFLAKQDHAFTTADDFNSMAVKLFPDSAIAKSYACGRTKATTLVTTVLAPEIQKEILAQCFERPFSVLLDETTDQSTSKQLAILIRYIDHSSDGNFRINTKLLDMVVVNKATGENLFNALANSLASSKLEISNMVGMASDSASNMVGKNNSCFSRIQECNENVFLAKCVCHIAATCSNDAAKALPQKLESFVSDVWAYFTHSASRLEDLEEFNQFLDDDTSPRRLLKPCQTRWLSLESCIVRVLDQWGRLMAYFNSKDDSKGKALAKRFNPVTKLYLLFLKDTLPLYNKFNKFFQV